jgi:hypothetical protein
MADTRTRKGTYHEWEWNTLRKCWEATVPLRIIPHDDGKFTVSTHEVWHDGEFDSFETAETEAVNGDADFLSERTRLEERVRVLKEALERIADPTSMWSEHATIARAAIANGGRDA